MFIEERHQKILDILETKGSINVAEIQRKFMVGYDTAKRDLRILEEKGLLKRTHGGAIPVHQVGAGKPSGVTCKDIAEIKPNYLAIAKKAVSMINDRDVVFITSASVGYLMTQCIPDDLRIRTRYRNGHHRKGDRGITRYNTLKIEVRLGFFYTTESCKKHPKINFAVLEMLLMCRYNKTKISACQ